MAKENNYWKVIAILFFLFGVVLFFYSQTQNKQTVEKLNQCVIVLNQTLIGWHDSIISVGKYCFNMTEAEIESHIQDNTFNNLNKGEVK